jgi:succinate dehydrogenase / fumarate reductase membrane anchor subunit
MSVQHWKFQRLSAIVLIPIVLYSLFYIVNMGAVSYDILIDDLGSFNGFLITSVFMGFILFHSSMGMEVIIEDYIHTENLQKNIVSLSKLFHIVSYFFTIIILASI